MASNLDMDYSDPSTLSAANGVLKVLPTLGVQSDEGLAPPPAAPATPAPTSQQNYDTLAHTKLSSYNMNRYMSLSPEDQQKLEASSPENQDAWLHFSEDGNDPQYTKPPAVEPKPMQSRHFTPPTKPVPPGGGSGGGGGGPAPLPQMETVDPKMVSDVAAAGLQANQDMATVRGKIATEQLPIQQQLAADNKASAEEMAQRMHEDRAALAAHIQKTEDFNEQAINVAENSPGHFWGHLDTAQKILTGIGIALSTAVSAASKGRIPNIGLGLFESAIEHDTQAQMLRAKTREHAADSEHDLAVMAKNMFDSDPVAYAALMKTKADAVATELNSVAAKYGSDVVKAAAEKAAADMKQKYLDNYINVIKQHNESKVQASEISKNRAAEARTNALLPGELEHQSLENAGIRNTGTVNGVQYTPQYGQDVRSKQAQVAGTVSVLQNLHDVATSADAMTNLTSKDALRARLAAAGIPQERVDAVLKNMPDRFSFADVSPIIDGLMHDQQKVFEQIGAQ